MFFRRKIEKIKVTVLEEKKLANGKIAFLILRNYSLSYIDEYVICLDYDFKSNTYDIGLKVSKLSEAYSLLNHLVKYGDFSLIINKKEDEDDEQEDEVC